MTQKEITLPSDAIDLCCFVSARLGRIADFPTSHPVHGKGSGGTASWYSREPGKGTVFVCVEWNDGAVAVYLDPDSQREWDQAWPIMGWCQYREIEVVAP
jgi:hypothetical protein